VDTDNLTVEHDETKRQFFSLLDSQKALVDYTREGEQIVFTHTEVPPEFEGKGVGSKLAKTALDYARANELEVVPLCPFFSTYIRRHKEYQDLVAAEGN
jgi:predicted GNAT family acetyltransferase